MNSRSRSAVRWSASIFIVQAPVIYAMFNFDFISVLWSPDTLSYLEYSPYRQPLYGKFYQIIIEMGFERYNVLILQLIIFSLSLFFIVSEVIRTHIPTYLLIIILLVLWYPLTNNMLSLSASYLSEALYYPLLFAMCALILRLYRTCDGNVFLLSILTIFAVVFLRSAAIAILLSSIVVILILFTYGNNKLRILALKSIILIVLLSAIVPTMFGRGLWEIRTTLDRSGLVFLPRVVMVPVSLDISEPMRSHWDKLNNSFIRAGSGLSCAERSMFESQLQEAVRYEIGPKFLSQQSDDGNVSRQVTYNQYLKIFKSAITESPTEYFLSSACHFWGMISAGTHLGTKSRLRVYKSLVNVDADIWKLAKFRTDYPLNRYDLALKPMTEVIYFSFRLLSLLGTLVGVIVSGNILYNAIFHKQKIEFKSLSWLILTGWLLALSMLIALSVYPDTRYILANFIIQWTLLVLGIENGYLFLKQYHSHKNK